MAVAAVVVVVAVEVTDMVVAEEAVPVGDTAVVVVEAEVRAEAHYQVRVTVPKEEELAEVVAEDTITYWVEHVPAVWVA